LAVPGRWSRSSRSVDLGNDVSVERIAKSLNVDTAKSAYEK
jgi:hypothetical protein